MKRTVLAVLSVAALATSTMSVLAQETLSAGTIDGTLAEASVTYELAAQEGDVFFISLSSAEFDTFVEINDAAGEQVTSNDDGGTGSNSAALFVAPAAGTYSVVVRSYNGEETGAYTLTLVTDIEEITVGSSVALNADGVTPRLFRLESSGGPLNISVDSGNTVSTTLTVLTPEGYFVTTSDSVVGSDPALSPTVLDEGTYYLIVAPNDEQAIGEVTLSIEAAELQVLSAEPTVFTFGNASRENVAIINVEEGTVYRIEVSNTAAGNFNLTLESADSTFYTYEYFSYTNGLGGVYLYPALNTETLQAGISTSFGFSDEEDVDYTITVTPVE